MAKMTAAERYAARKIRTALGLRNRTLESANRGARHARLYQRYEPDWQGQLSRSLNARESEWSAIADRNLYRAPFDSESGRHEWSAISRPYLRPANPGREAGVV